MNNKSNHFKLDSELYSQYSLSQTNLQDEIRESTVYEMAHWTNNTDRWLKNRGEKNTKGYKATVSQGKTKKRIFIC